MLYDDTNIHESINSPARALLAGAPYNPGVSLAGTDEKGIKRNFQRRLLPNVTHTDDDENTVDDLEDGIYGLKDTWCWPFHTLVAPQVVI